MGNIVNIVNNYDNGVCDGFKIYTGTTYNGDPFVIPNTATPISNNLISLPYAMDMGTYEGPLYIFLEHCDGHTPPPPTENPKKQGGFQVQFLNIECFECPTPTPTPTFEATPTPTPTFEATPTPTPMPFYYYLVVDCNSTDQITIRSFVELQIGQVVTRGGRCWYIKSLGTVAAGNDIGETIYDTCDDCLGITPTPTPEEPTPTPTYTPTYTPTFTPTPTPEETPTPTPTPEETPTPTPTPEAETFYRIEDCRTGNDFHLPKDRYCSGGNIALQTLNFSLNDVVQYTFNNSGSCGTETYCGTIIDTNFSAPPNSHTGYVSRIVPVPACGDTIHCGE